MFCFAFLFVYRAALLYVSVELQKKTLVISKCQSQENKGHLYNSSVFDHTDQVSEFVTFLRAVIPP